MCPRQFATSHLTDVPAEPADVVMEEAIAAAEDSVVSDELEGIAAYKNAMQVSCICASTQRHPWHSHHVRFQWRLKYISDRRAKRVEDTKELTTGGRTLHNPGPNCRSVNERHKRMFNAARTAKPRCSPKHCCWVRRIPNTKATNPLNHPTRTTMTRARPTVMPRVSGPPFE